MFVSRATVKTHLVFAKLEVHNRTELTARAIRRNATG
jgi:DNA-binding NarL/FixJ family response regulator